MCFRSFFTNKSNIRARKKKYQKQSFVHPIFKICFGYDSKKALMLTTWAMKERKSSNPTIEKKSPTLKDEVWWYRRTHMQRKKNIETEKKNKNNRAGDRIRISFHFKAHWNREQVRMRWTTNGITPNPTLSTIKWYFSSVSGRGQRRTAEMEIHLLFE